MNFQKFQLNWKILKHCASLKQRSAWRELFSPPPIKTSYASETKIFERRFTEKYRYLLSRCSENAVFGGLKIVQCKCFFWHQSERCFWLCYGSIFFVISSVECVEVRKMSEVFWEKLNCKMIDIFCYFLLTLRLSNRKC